MIEVRALTLHQPWASLVAVGAKTIETRSWSVPSTVTMPLRLLIHAGKEWYVGWWSDALIRATAHAYGGFEKYPHGGPLGAVVASATLTDCVPMVDHCTTDMHMPAHVCQSGALLIHRPENHPFPDGETEHDVSDQLPFGDFSPGRWAWLLDDVKPTTERCPRCWGEGWIERTKVDGSSGEYRWLCPACTVRYENGDAEDVGRGVGAPVPMRGRQGLWTPTWEDAA